MSVIIVTSTTKRYPDGVPVIATARKNADRRTLPIRKGGQEKNY
nr:hypothetical protein [uncultured Methanoregula sp.]